MAYNYQINTTCPAADGLHLFSITNIPFSALYPKFAVINIFTLLFFSEGIKKQGKRR